VYKRQIICGYHLYRLFYTDRARYIRKAEGFIRIRSKRVIDGKVKRVKRQIRVRWDAAGICFRASDNQRLPQYDLPLKSVQNKGYDIKSGQLCM
jgi:hypothetical protein